MYIIIAGGGIVGRKITAALSKDHDIVVIEKSKELCERISSKYGAIAIQGDATNIVTLREAGIERCDYALGVMREDSLNLVFSLLAKNFGIKNIFVRMRDPEYRDAYEIAGATNIAAAVEMMSKKFIMDIQNPDIRRVASLSGGKAEISIVVMPQDGKYANSTISQLVAHEDFPNDCVIAGIFDDEQDKLIIPHGDTIIKDKNQIFLVGSRDNIAKVFQFLSQKNTGILQKLHLQK